MNDSTTLTTLSDWFETEQGKQLVAYECAQIARFLPDCFGSELLQIGGPRKSEWLDASPIKHKIYLSSEIGANADGSTCVAHPFYLPFLPDSLDVILLPHSLECVQEPRALLAEACDVLKPGGFMIITGINRKSLWGIQHGYQHLKSKYSYFPWLQQFLSIHSIENKLLQNNCVIDGTHIGCYQGVGEGNAAWLKEHSLLDILGPLLWPTFGAVYVILARKKIPGWIVVPEKSLRDEFCETKVGWV
ncbi:MAG: methyltransferase domain-containing protein [Legionellales bacterium]|nr:methyltransferase domain-containing protein [Legionellales bacterium]